MFCAARISASREDRACGCSRLMTSARLSRLLHGRVGTDQREGWCASIVIYISHHPRHLGLRPFSHLLRSGSDVRAEYARGGTHTYTYTRTHLRTVHTRTKCSREPTQLWRHSPPVFALAWHGTASLFGHFRPGQAPPTFILITSWFAPGFCSPSFFPGERFPTADAWEPHLCPLAYSCPGLATRASTFLSPSLSFSLFLYFPSAPSSLVPVSRPISRKYDDDAL